MTSLGYLSLLIIWSLVSSVVVVLSLLLTNPLTIGPIGVTGWFVVLLSDFISLATLGLYAAKSYLHLHEGSKTSRLRYSARQGLLLGGWLAALLALSSLNQLGLRDAILLGLLLVIVELYVRFRWP